MLTRMTFVEAVAAATIGLFFAVLVPRSAVAETLKLDGATVEWDAVSTAGAVHVHGEGGVATGTVEKGADGKFAAVVECQLAAFKTGRDLRDEHMRDKYLQTAKFPTAKLVIPATAPGVWTGELTLKDETSPVSGTAAVRDDGTFTAEFVVSLARFPHVGSPAWLGVEIAKDVTVKVKGKLTR